MAAVLAMVVRTAGPMPPYQQLMKTAAKKSGVV
jgi:hypothetical protein